MMEHETAGLLDGIILFPETTNDLAVKQEIKNIIRSPDIEEKFLLNKYHT